MPDFGSANLAYERVRLVDATGAPLTVLPTSPVDAAGTAITGPTSPASRIASAANSNNATVAKASAGRLYNIRGVNAAAATRWIKFYNKATTPAPASDNALLMAVFALQASLPFAIDLGLWGLPFSLGISYALVTGSSDTDNTSVTAADILGLNVIYG